MLISMTWNSCLKSILDIILMISLVTLFCAFMITKIQRKLFQNSFMSQMLKILFFYWLIIIQILLLKFIKIFKKLSQNSLTQHILIILLFHFVIMIQILSLSLHLSQCMTTVLTYLLLHQHLILIINIEMSNSSISLMILMTWWNLMNLHLLQ